MNTSERGAALNNVQVRYVIFTCTVFWGGGGGGGGGGGVVVVR